MKKLFGPILAAVLLTGVSFAQSPQPNGGSESQGSAVRFVPAGTLRVELTKSVDAKKAKVGDEIVGRTMDDFLSSKNEMLAPKGSKVVGHVAETSVHEGESPSTLGIVFDKLVLKNGTDVPFKASIQAIGRPDLSAAPENQPLPQSGGGAPTMSPGHDPDGYGSMGRGGMSSSNGPASSANSGADSGTGPLRPDAQGVVGLSGISLSAGSAQDSLISSQKRNVKLDSGTQMILHVAQ